MHSLIIKRNNRVIIMENLIIENNGKQLIIKINQTKFDEVFLSSWVKRLQFEATQYEADSNSKSDISLCFGAWLDNKSADEIIKEIESERQNIRDEEVFS